MKLSKQERIAAIVVLVLVILVAGVFLFIKPNIETINSTKETLRNKEKEYNDAVAKVGTKDQLKTQILESYDRGKNLADMFFPELAAYEADNEFRAFLETCEANVLIEDLSVNAPSTESLSTNVFVPAQVQYALKDYVNQGGSNEITDPGLVRQEMIRSALGDPQTIGATTVGFTVKAVDTNELLKFADEVNRYQKSENGKNIRKAIELSGVEISDPLAAEAFEALATSITNEAEAAAVKAFKEKTGLSVEGYIEAAPTTPAQTPTEDEDGNIVLPTETTGGSVSISNYLYEMTCTIKFYSIERMQDPTPTLEEQDKAV